MIEILLVIGAVLGGLGAFVGGTVAAIVAIKGFKKINDIDHAVNGRPKGAQTLQSQVADIHSDRPAPPDLPPEDEDVAIREMVKMLVADMHQRRNRGT